MKTDKIQETTNGLRRVNELLGKYVREQALSFGEKRELWLFYKEHEDTNALIDCAVAMAEEDLDLLFSDAQLLLKAAEELIKVYKGSASLFSSFDTKADCNAHLQPFKDPSKNIASEKDSTPFITDWEDHLETLRTRGRESSPSFLSLCKRAVVIGWLPFFHAFKKRRTRNGVWHLWHRVV